MFVRPTVEIQYVPLTLALVSVHNICGTRFVLIRIECSSLGEIIAFQRLMMMTLAVPSY